MHASTHLPCRSSRFAFWKVCFIEYCCRFFVCCCFFGFLRTRICSVLFSLVAEDDGDDDSDASTSNARRLNTPWCIDFRFHRCLLPNCNWQFFLRVVVDCDEAGLCLESFVWDGTVHADMTVFERRKQTPKMKPFLTDALPISPKRTNQQQTWLIREAKLDIFQGP